jgi:hypothetical protein
VETVATDGNPHTPRIPTAAWKAKTAFHSSHEAQQQFHHLFERQRYTLNRRIFGPKNGEHFTRRGQRGFSQIEREREPANESTNFLDLHTPIFAGNYFEADQRHQRPSWH